MDIVAVEGRSTHVVYDSVGWGGVVTLPGSRAMSKIGRAVKGAQAGAVAAAGVALSFFVLDLLRFQPLATPGFLSGAVYGPSGLEWDFTSMSGVIAGLVTAYRITTFTLLHFLSFALVGVFAALNFDWKHRIGLKALLAVAVLCTAAFSVTVAAWGSLVALESLGPVTVVGMNLFAAILLVGFLRLANMPEPGDVPPA